MSFKSETFRDKRQYCNNCASGFRSLKLYNFLAFINVDYMLIDTI